MAPLYPAEARMSRDMINRAAMMGRGEVPKRLAFVWKPPLVAEILLTGSLSAPVQEVGEQRSGRRERFFQSMHCELEPHTFRLVT